MASVFRKSKSPYYFAAFRGALGQRIQRTTKLTNKADALDMARAWEKAAAKGAARTLTESAARKVVGEILADSTGEKLRYFTVRQWLENWIANKEASTTDGTITRYRRIATRFLEHLGERGVLSIESMGVQDIRAFRDSMNGRGVSARTINQDIRALRSPFNSAIRQGLLTHNPCLGVDELRDLPDVGREPFTLEQIGKLMASASDEWRGAIVAGYTTALRLSDIAALTWGALDMETATVSVRPKKTGKPLTIPLHPDFLEWLHTRTRGIGKAPVFPGLLGVPTDGRKGLSTQFAAIMAKAGVQGRLLRGEKKGRRIYSLSFHSLRHSAVSVLADAGVPEEVRRMISGHASGAMHANYTHLQLATVRDAVAKMPRVALSL